MKEVDSGIYCVDCDYVQPELACAYIMLNEKGRAAFLETNTSLAVPRFLEALQILEIPAENVDWIIPTHVHLDHAGGAGALLNECKDATVLAHPRAARHLIDPGRLIQSSIQVYGEETFQKLYGEIIPCEETRVRIMADGELLYWEDRTLEFLHTRGHANHHFCIFEKSCNGVFTGDSFGIAYPDLQSGGDFLFASSTPTDFDPEAAHGSLKKIRSTGADKVFLTHFGRLDNLDAAESQLHESLEFLEKLLTDASTTLASGKKENSDSDQDSKSAEENVQRQILDHWIERLNQNGLQDSVALNERLNMDAALNAAGIVFAARRAIKKG